MGIIKKIAACVLLILICLTLGLTGVFLLVDNTILIGQVVKQIESATGTRVSYKEGGVITRTLSPMITINDLKIENPNTDLKVYTNLFQLQISLPGLLMGNLEIPKLVLGNTLVEIGQGNGGGQTKPVRSFFFKPVLHDIRILQMSILHANEKYSLAAKDIRQLTIKADPETDELICNFKTKIEDEILNVVTTLPSVQKILKQQQLPFSLSVVHPFLNLSSNGLIELQSSPPTIAASVQARMTDPVNFFSISENLPLSGDVSATAQISGTFERLSIRKCKLNIKTINELDLNLAGQLDLVYKNSNLKTENMDLKLDFTSPNTYLAQTFLFDKIPKSGIIQGQAEIHSTNGAPSLDNIVIKTLHSKEIKFDLTGRIANIFTLSGFDLGVDIRLDKPNWPAGILPLPIIGPLEANYSIKGNTQSLRLENINLSAGKKNGIRVNTSGRILFGKWDQTDPIEFVDLVIGLKSQTTSQLGEAMGKHLPEFGSVTAQARLHTVSKNIRLDDIQVKLMDKKPLQIAVKGAASKVTFFPKPAVEGIRLELTASGETAALLTDIFSLQMAAPATSRFKAGTMIIENNQKIGIKDLSFVTSLAGKDKQSLDLIITGEMDDVKNINTLSLNAMGTAKNLQIIGRLLDQKWPDIGPVKLSSSIFKKNKGIEFDTLLTAGKTTINATTHIISRNGIPGISGRVLAQNLFLPDLFEKKDKPAINTGKDKLSFFSRVPIELDWLKKVDLDLFVDIASFDHDKLNLKSTKFNIDLDSGHLDIESGRVVFPKGEVLFDAYLELEKDLNLRVKASGIEINPWHTLSIGQTKLSKSFNADLDIDIDIATSGANEYELFSNMNGDVYILLKNGKIRKELIDMLFTDLIGWTIDKTMGNKKYVDINCGVMDYRIKKGTIITDAFFLDGKNMTIVGDGTIDLAKEQIAYVFLPKKKSRLILKAEPVKVNGPLSNPKVTVLPWKSAISNYGSLFFGPYVFVGVSAFKFLTNSLRKEDTISPCLKYEKKHDQNIKNAFESKP